MFYIYRTYIFYFYTQCKPATDYVGLVSMIKKLNFRPYWNVNS